MHISVVNRRAANRVGLGLLLLAGLLPRLVMGETSAQTKAKVDFNRDIRPILSEHCYACHGPDQAKRKAGLRLDRKEEAFKALESGKTAIVAGQAEKSELVRRITTTDKDDLMPPSKGGKPLSSAQVDLLRRWVGEGAEWKGHWAYLKPEKPALPEVKEKGWPKNPIDNFVLERQEAAGMKPSPEADKTTLLRRVSLDLTGLPPTIEEIESFLGDTSNTAYEKVVDRLLKSPHYGERMGQFWLDLARFSDSQGYHHDAHREVWKWRDWVINAFNNNMPFDQFTTEQLAGDLLPNATTEQKLATGFHRNEMTTSEGGADPNEYAVKYVVGRVDVTSRVWLGTSMACAECHDHKFDPVSQKEYYQFFAYFNTIAENGMDATENPVPRLTVATPEQQAKIDQFNKEVGTLETAHKALLEGPNAEWDKAMAAWQAKQVAAATTAWTPLPPASLKAKSGAELVVKMEDNSVLAQGTNAPQETYEVTLRTPMRGIKGLRIEALPDANLPKQKAGRDAAGDFVLTGVELTARSLHPDKAESTPTAMGTWRALGPLKAGSAKEAFDKSFVKEDKIDLGQTFEGGQIKWTEQPAWQDGTPHELKGENSAFYFYRTITVSEPKWIKVFLGSDDGIQVWLNGAKLLSKDVARGVAPDQDSLLLRLTAGENRLLVKVSNGAGAGGFYFRPQAEPVTEHPVAFASAAADYSQKDFPASAVLDDKPASGWSVGGTEDTDTRRLYLLAKDSFGFKEGTELTVRLHFHSAKTNANLGHFRLAVTDSDEAKELAALPESVRGTLLAKTEKQTPAGKLEAQKYYRQTFVAEVPQLEKLVKAQKEAKDNFVKTIPIAMVMGEMEKPRDTFFLVRGDFQNKGEKVTVGPPQRLFAAAADLPPNRLGLAKWLTDPNNPLVSRVTVNHFWQQYFGNGLVKTAEDFGSQGEWPSHPELLDWLATEFVGSKWNVKALQKLIVMSATYRQASRVSKENLERDPENRLLARFPRLRLEAEAIRDTVMSASGLLNRQIGGPSVYPYQPPGLWETVAFEGTRKYNQSVGADNYRRGLYTYWRRSIPYASFVAFDAPNRETCTIRRPRTNTPLQALTLLNDPVYVEASRALGQRVLREGGASMESRLTYAFRVSLGRAPSKLERYILEKAYLKHLHEYEQDRLAAAKLINIGATPPPFDLDICELAAWTAIGNTILNLDEMITKG